MLYNQYPEESVSKWAEIALCDVTYFPITELDTTYEGSRDYAYTCDAEVEDRTERKNM